ncbi:Transposase (plasmid) [Roseomonas mucosa]|uniref:ATP-binding protein n=1 Tax=Roseomonas TaxID=125216 RepID=UPI00267ACD47|nr:Transposase [Roseomonas mucosa]
MVHFIGQSGTGKSHLAVALGVEAVRAGRSVYFCPLADIIDSLARADREGRLRQRIRYLCRAQLLIIDEIGYVTLGAAAGMDFPLRGGGVRSEHHAAIGMTASALMATRASVGVR